MKLRIRGSSLRLRLTQGEVTQFAEHGRIEEYIAFGVHERDRLSYIIEQSDRPGAIAARLESGSIVVTVPTDLARRWVETDSVTLEAEQPIDAGSALRIVIEKDFACLKPRLGENDDDAFPNPNTSC